MIVEYNKKDSKKDLFDFLAKENKLEKVVVDFFATWCGPCKMQLQTFDEVNHDNVLIVKVDIDKFQNLPTEFGVRGVPTLFMLNAKSEIINKNVGYLNPGNFTEWVGSSK